jgi:hypothetical protein
MEKYLMRVLVSRIAGLVSLVALMAGCTGVRVPEEWQPLLEEVRAYEQRIGFTKTTTFVTFSEEQGRVPFCGHVSRLYLPYSYEDPAILWYNVQTERECRAHADGADVYFGTVEALGEMGALSLSDPARGLPRAVQFSIWDRGSTLQPHRLRGHGAVQPGEIPPAGP